MGTYQTEQSLAERSLKSSRQIASFAATHIDRFGGHESHFKMSDAPGVGAYDSTAFTSKESASLSKMSSTMASTTDRFNSHDSHFTVSEAPAVGLYTPNDDVRIKGATKLQRSIRRRQSRGIFASVEARAKQMPDMYSYADAKPAAMAEATAKGHELAANRSVLARFDGPSSHFHKQDVPEAGDYNPHKVSVVRIASTSSSLASRSPGLMLSCVPRHKGQGSIYGRSSISRVSTDAPDGGSAATRLLSTAFVLEHLSSAGIESNCSLRLLEQDSNHGKAEADDMARILNSPSEQVDTFVLSEDEETAFAALQAAVEKAPIDLASVAEEAEAIDFVAEADITESEHGQGQRHEKEANSCWEAVDHEAIVVEAEDVSDVIVPSAETSAEGERLFEMLLASSGTELNRLDYFDKSNGWDFNGLRSDLQLGTD